MVFDAFLRFRRPKPGQKQTYPDTVDEDIQQQRHQNPLWTISNLPPWYEPSPFILTGYRPESRSWYTSLSSWAYVHNESGNIYSHLIPGVILLLLVGQGSLYEYLNMRHAGLLSWVDWMVVAGQMPSGACCLLVSAVYHTGLNHSEGVARCWLGVDYGGILLLLLGDFVSGLHFGFYCAPVLKALYCALVCSLSSYPGIVILASATGMLLLSPRFSGPEWRSFRLGCFIGTGLTAFAPIAHALVLWGPAYVCGIGVPYYLLEGLFLIIGCYFWETRIPERLYPGKFDFWGHSHTIWHVFVTLSIGAHLCGLLHAMDYTYSQPCPASN